MNKFGQALLLAVIAILVACGTQPTRATEPQPAFIASPSQETSAVIEGAVANMLGQNRVQIADAPFSESHVLVVHRQQLLGRELGLDIDRFQLLILGEDCLLRHEGTEKFELVKAIDCEPLPPREPRH